MVRVMSARNSTILVIGAVLYGWAWFLLGVLVMWMEYH
jgi:hypothetical protein